MIIDTNTDRASHFVECVRNYKGQAFCDKYNNEIADIIFHAITNWQFPATSCGLDHNDLAWRTIVDMLEEFN